MVKGPEGAEGSALRDRSQNSHDRAGSRLSGPIPLS